MGAGGFGTVRDLAIAMNLAERHVSKQVRLAYLAPKVLRRLICMREVTAVTLMQLTESAALVWAAQPQAVFAGPSLEETMQLWTTNTKSSNCQ